jgi:hypothetical protein
VRESPKSKEKPGKEHVHGPVDPFDVTAVDENQMAFALFVDIMKSNGLNHQFEHPHGIIGLRNRRPSQARRVRGRGGAILSV